MYKRKIKSRHKTHENNSKPKHSEWLTKEKNQYKTQHYMKQKRERALFGFDTKKIRKQNCRKIIRVENVVGGTQQKKKG